MRLRGLNEGAERSLLANIYQSVSLHQEARVGQRYAGAYVEKFLSMEGDLLN